MPTYNADDLCVHHKSLAFMAQPRFKEAYARGVNSGHQFGHDLHIEWRIHVSLWAASHAMRLEGDFVECGVNTGIASLAICHYVNLNATPRLFWLFDTFQGIPEEQMSADEKALGRVQHSRTYYRDCYEIAKNNFAPYSGARLVRGRVPDTLANVEISKVAYLSLDMNIVEPEMAAIRHFWPKLSPGAPVVLDDYGWAEYAPQQVAMDAFADSVGCKVLTLPTGQGLLLKA